jgi:hypothetical protein
LLDPIAEYDHGDGIAVVGGFVYRGASIPALRGKYVFGDFSRGFFTPGGRLFWLDADGDLGEIFEFRLAPDDAPLERFLFGFGEDERGDLYVTTSQSLGPTGNTGEVWRIVDGAEGRIEICHLPATAPICQLPATAPESPQTITVSASSVAAHLAHGDSLGACD